MLNIYNLQLPRLQNSLLFQAMQLPKFSLQKLKAINRRAWSPFHH